MFSSKQKTVKGGLERLCETAKSFGIEESHTDAFFYCVSLDHIGIPKNILGTFLERVFIECAQFELLGLLRRMLYHFEIILQKKLLGGMEIFVIRDSNVIEVIQEKNNKGLLHEKYFHILKEILLDTYGPQQSIMDESSVEKQRLMLNDLAFFQRVLLKYGSKEDVKMLFMFNFDYLFAKLSFHSFAHLFDEVTTVTAKHFEDYDLAVLSELVQLSREGLGVDSTQFPLQIISRLDPCKLSDQNGDDSAGSQLKRLHDGALSLCGVLKPNRACLLLPSAMSNLNREEQNNWSCKDLKFMFFKNPKYEFVGWRTDTQEIFFYDHECCVQRSEKFEGLNKIVLCMQDHLLIETKLGIHVLYNMNTLQSVFSINNDYDVVGTDQKHRLILLKTDTRLIMILDIEQNSCVWRFESNKPNNNVYSSSNGRISLCFSDNRRKTPTRSTRGKSFPDSEKNKDPDEEEEETYEEITILDLEKLSKVTTINLPTEASFSKLFLVSEDGDFFVRVTEPDMNIMVWNLNSGLLHTNIETKCCRIVRAAVSSAGNVIVTVSSDASLRVYNLDDGSLRYTLTECVKSVRMDGQHCLSLSPNGQTCVYFVRSNFQPSFVSVWNLCNGRQVASLTTDFYGLTYQISNDSSYMVSNFPSGLVRFELS